MASTTKATDGQSDKKPAQASEDTSSTGPESLMETVSDPDIDTDPAEEIEEKGEPFEGNYA